MDRKFVVIVHLHAKKGCEEELIDTLRINMEQTHREAGVERFTLNRNLNDPTRFVVVEVYKSRDDYDKHHATAHYAACVAKLPSLMEEMFASTYYETLKIGDPKKGSFD